MQVMLPLLALIFGGIRLVLSPVVIIYFGYHFLISNQASDNGLPLWLGFAQTLTFIAVYQGSYNQAWCWLIEAGFVSDTSSNGNPNNPDTDGNGSINLSPKSSNHHDINQENTIMKENIDSKSEQHLEVDEGKNLKALKEVERDSGIDSREDEEEGLGDDRDDMSAVTQTSDNTVKRRITRSMSRRLKK